jgi:K+/H+ antiporter YhaU regulatory subunit KhtT
MAVENGYDCNQHFIAHDQEIKRNAENIDKILAKLEGIPEKIDGMNKRIDDVMSIVMKSETNYLRKDVFEGEKTIVHDKLGDHNEQLNKLWFKWDKTVYAIMGGGFYIIIDLLKSFIK